MPGAAPRLLFFNKYMILMRRRTTRRTTQADEWKRKRAPLTRTFLPCAVLCFLVCGCAFRAPLHAHQHTCFRFMDCFCVEWLDLASGTHCGSVVVLVGMVSPACFGLTSLPSSPSHTPTSLNLVLLSCRRTHWRRVWFLFPPHSPPPAPCWACQPFPWTPHCAICLQMYLVCRVRGKTECALVCPPLTRSHGRWLA